MEEIWKDIEGYEGLYQVSNFGNIKSIKRRRTKGGKLKETMRYGYKYVTLSKYGKIKRLSVHRLVAQAFIPNPNNYDIVNHKDENKSNNYATNLEWCTQAQNVQYSKKTSSILQLDLNGNIIKEWESARNAEINNGFDNSCIIKCCKGKRKSHKGYRWQYKFMS